MTKDFKQLDPESRKQLFMLAADMLLSDSEPLKEDKPQQYRRAPMRTIHKAIEELKNEDPDTALTEYALKRLVVSGEIPCVKAGSKRLVNMDIVRRYLNDTYAAQRGAEQHFKR